MEDLNFNKILRIKFWTPESAIAFQIMDQEGLPYYKREGRVHTTNGPFLEKYQIGLWSFDVLGDRDIRKIPSIIFKDNEEKQKALLRYINSI